jgi:predicted phosphodiesterase
MRICCTSDLHGHLPDVEPCDLLLIGGDLCPVHSVVEQAVWLQARFAPWLRRQPARSIVGVAGNHDFIFQRAPELVPSLPWTYLQDSGTEVDGLKAWGSPHQLPFYDWAFNLPEAELAKRWELIPDDTDILLLHGPPYGVGDYSPYGKVNTGSPSLLARIEAIQPRLVVFGHIHAGYGQYRIGPTLAINASNCDEQYCSSNPVVVVEV